MYMYILVYTSILFTGIYQHALCFQTQNFFEIRWWIQHGTRQYNEVPKSPVPLNKAVQEST
jgi:hypothetical protein